MLKKRYVAVALLCLVSLAAWGCGEYGKVDQGRTVAFDKEAGTVTLIRDKANDWQHPDYSILPPFTYKVPADKKEMGPDPKAGYRMKLDVEKNKVVYYDPKAVVFKTVDFTLIDTKEKIAKDHPLVKDKKFPAIDRDKKTITIFSGRQKLLVTFSVPDEYFELPDATWDAGDEVRVYYKEEGVSLRMMNVTKTDIFKK
jgi:hypothetical protein